ncbi:predicted coding region AF_1939 [Archaeoglobus fulgidus DSM 4304]|jgi:hypothetical protein|uniref:Uncharacterized protein AF_1939 n=3 Tax=Archaeoglobus fulgidus TaxID=2234 RepID=Y1939_ARCFU|nr:RecName: Full=Uncharacterized protein AF_1939 [Archaeoglobus fulgidus DSM 4304]AAB89328.1 predicted coding region AF_1939 [Archaeoglobus fulgidus DSM 4304]AIG98933.1 hypothetical protein AFULGI_00021990 [Archaeoglobus fulgidus DSM 8774]KUJ93772.1 MAG: hypothetical protein XD40_0993 [Archaeoglobus fulgidus]KUK05733.1 MAG: Uncharacterized protein XD48_2036 [Archaeoglobus fulgidus]
MTEAERFQMIKESVSKNAEKLTRMDIFEMVRKKKIIHD